MSPELLVAFGACVLYLGMVLLVALSAGPKRGTIRGSGERARVVEGPRGRRRR